MDGEIKWLGGGFKAHFDDHRHLSHMLKGNTKTDLKLLDGVWNRLTQNRDQWRADVNEAMTRDFSTT